MNSVISEQLHAIDLHIENIYLDPNNPRFVRDKWIKVQPERIQDIDIQAEARKKMEDAYNIEKLSENMRINGYLPIDRIVVQHIDDGNYVVLEGNRRITAAKQICEEYNLNAGIDEAVYRTFDRIPCLEYKGEDTDAAWIFQGIRHISGIADWSAYHKARMLTERQDEEKVSLTELGQRFGLSAWGAGAWIRGYRAYTQAKDESAYQREINERIYPYFQEIFNRSNISLRNWLDWDEKNQRFANDLNLDELLSWFYPREDPEDGTDVNDLRGDWDKRIVTTVHTLRNIAYLLTNAMPHFEQFLISRDLEGSVAIAKAQVAENRLESEREPADELLNTLDGVIKQLDNIPMRRFRQRGELMDELKDKLNTLHTIVAEIRQEIGI